MRGKALGLPSGRWCGSLRGSSHHPTRVFSGPDSYEGQQAGSEERGLGGYRADGPWRLFPSEVSSQSTSSSDLMPGLHAQLRQVSWWSRSKLQWKASLCLAPGQLLLLWPSGTFGGLGTIQKRGFILVPGFKIRPGSALLHSAPWS